MRISDWSSDVCSSDLHAHELPREGTEARDARTGFRRLSLWREQRRSGRRRLRHRLVMSRSQQRKAPLRCAGLQQCRMENIERNDGEPPLAQMMTPRFIEMCQRSEEHTSEHTSLMRIS